MTSHAAQCILAGARVTMTASGLLHKGIQHAFSVLTDLHRWLEAHQYASVWQMCGSMSRRSVPDPTAFKRGNYLRVLSSYPLRPGHHELKPVRMRRLRRACRNKHPTGFDGGFQRG